MAKTVKVRFIKSPTGAPYYLAYSIGQIGEVTPELLVLLQKDGMIELVEKAKTNRGSKVKKETR